MRLLIPLAISAGLSMAACARAGEALDLLRGYGKARWGQTIEEVRKLYGDKIKGMDGYAIGSRADASLSDEASVIDLKLPDPDPLVSLVLFRFLEDRLCAVQVILTTKAREATSNETLAKIIWDKYYADPGVRAQLAEHRLVVWLSYTGRKSAPKSLADLLPAQQSTSNVWYENRELWDQYASEAGDRARQKAEEAKQEASEMKLKEVL